MTRTKKRQATPSELYENSLIESRPDSEIRPGGPKFGDSGKSGPVVESDDGPPKLAIMVCIALSSVFWFVLGAIIF